METGGNKMGTNRLPNNHKGHSQRKAIAHRRNVVVARQNRSPRRQPLLMMMPTATFIN